MTAREQEPTRGQSPENPLIQAVRLHQSGRIDDALGLYRRILAAYPDQPDALNLGGVAAFQKGDRKLARQWLQRAVEVAPGSPEAHNNFGNVLQESGEWALARDQFEIAVRLRPDFAQAYKNLGNALQLLQRTTEAVTAYREALHCEPRDAEAEGYLAAALGTLGAVDEAAASYRRAIEIRPDDAKFYNSLGAILQKKGELEAGVEACRKAIELAPNYAKAHFNLGCLLQVSRRNAEAVEAYRHALALAPADAGTWYNLGLASQALGQLEDASGAYRKTLDLAPDHASAGHMLDALAGRTTDIAPGPHIKEMFDNYARTFESHLLETLGYSAPDVLHAAVAATLAASGESGRRFGRMLDMGCGTGLVSRQFRDQADHIEGIDLSPNMVQLARESGLFEQVHETTLDAFFEQLAAAETFDLVTSADVFIYIGRLDEIFEKVSKCLISGGLFAFSVERVEEGRYCLQTSGRYAQSEAYIRDLADQSRFAVAQCRPFTIRQEYESPIEGLAFVLQRT